MTLNPFAGFAMAGLLASASPLALAQEADAPVLREPVIIVTTPGAERDAAELIGNASRIEREDIVERLSSTLGDTLDREPGVATTFFGQGASRPVLRGLGAERVQVLTNGMGVIDASAASPDHQVSADAIDAQAVEILRGPAALAYGGQAIGGVVNVIDGLIVEEMPDEAVSGEAFAAHTNVSRGSELAARGQFAFGPLVATLSASQRDFGDYDIPGFAESARAMAEEHDDHDDDHDEDHDDDHDEHSEELIEGRLPNSFVETETLAGGLSWVGERGFIGVAVRQQTSLYGLPGHSHEHGEEHGEDHDEDHEGEEHDEEHDEHGEEEEENPFIDLEQTRIDLRAGLTLDHSVLTDLSASVAIVDYEHTEFEAPGEPGTVYETDGVEARIELGHVIAGFEGALGLQYLDKELGAFGDEAFITPTTTQSLAVFLYEAREWDSGMGIEGGLRVESVELDNVLQGERSFDLFSGSLGVHQHWESSLFLGAQASWTERAPNESELFSDGAHLATSQFEIGDVDLSKERGLNLELAARYRAGIFGIGANAFLTEFEDFIFLAPGEALDDGVLVDELDGLPVFLFRQDGASFVGGEIYGDFALDDGLLGAEWEGRASLDYVSAELDGGGNVPFLPPLTLNAEISAEWGAFEIGADVTIAADQDDPGAGQLPTDGYTLIGLRGEFDISDYGLGADGTEAFIEVRNISNEEVRYSTSVLKDDVPAPGTNLRFGVRAVF